MKKILISACLLRVPCRYDGKAIPYPKIEALKEKYELIPVCPEELGGLSTPRPPAEIRGDRVITRQGKDVTDAFMIGARKTLEIAQEQKVICAVLKEKSPSCGKGIPVYGESQIQMLL
jgi:uncharacterized protein YbbK (DUF523 family)